MLKKHSINLKFMFILNNIFLETSNLHLNIKINKKKLYLYKKAYTLFTTQLQIFI